MKESQTTEDALKSVLTLGLGKESRDIEAVPLYEELIISDNIDEDLDRSHVMYSFCVILGAEYEHRANTLEAKMDKWAGEKWRKLKTSTTSRYTDNDAKRKIESSPYYMRMRIRISKLRKLSKQLAFGGGKALDMKASNLRNKIFRQNKMDDDFNVRDRDFKNVENSIKRRLKAR
jgi:hypothetical protein